ncbi:MAG: NgoFVII family restriction endonuclease [Eubacteriales bacterium]|nr:NgoFVII family restriction endonuclease [Eubacteriales bacterium]
MYFDELSEIAFFTPMKKEVNRLCILTGYATPNMASWLMKNISERLRSEKIGKEIDISLIVGMVPFDGLSVAVHEGFKELQTSTLPEHISKFVCSYVYGKIPVHTKIYIWLKDDVPVMALTGSANFTQISFSSQRRENLIECNPLEAYQYYSKIEGETIYCNHSEIEENIVLYPTHPVLDLENNPLKDFGIGGVEKVDLSLLNSKTGETHRTAGLNWGQRKNKYTLKNGEVRYGDRNKNESYIPLPAPIARSGFFPLNKQHFSVITDDKHHLILRIEQGKDKAITTPMSNALLGEYFRNRLGLANGAYINRADLESYGRTDVTFYKFDEEQYYMDFSSCK